MVRAAKLERLTVTLAELVGGATTMCGVMSSTDWSDLHEWEEDAIRRAEVALVRLELEVDEEQIGRITTQYRDVYKMYSWWHRQKGLITSGKFKGDELRIRDEMETKASDASVKCEDIRCRARRYVRELHDRNQQGSDPTVSEPRVPADTLPQ